MAGSESTGRDGASSPTLRGARPWHRPPTPELRYLPEGPLLLPGEASPRPGRWLAWVAIQHGPDAQRGSVNLLAIDTGESIMIELPGRPGFVVATTRPGVLMVGLERELVLLDIAGARPSLTPTGLKVDEDASTVINDGVATPVGLLFGTKDPGFAAPLGGLYLLRHGEQRLIKLRDGIVCSNGKAVAPDGRGWLLYDIDSPTRTVRRHRLFVEAGELDAGETWLDLTHEEHVPDGMRLAPDLASVVIAFYHPGAPDHGLARQYRLADARLLAEWHVPRSPRVTCPAFVATDQGIELVLTTAAEGMPGHQQTRDTEAGTLFRAETAFALPLPPCERLTIAAADRSKEM